MASLSATAGLSGLAAIATAAEKPRHGDVALAFALETWSDVFNAFGNAATSRGLADGAAPGLVVVKMDRRDAEELLATLAAALNFEVRAVPPATMRSRP